MDHDDFINSYKAKKASGTSSFSETLNVVCDELNQKFRISDTKQSSLYGMFRIVHEPGSKRPSIVGSFLVDPARYTGGARDIFPHKGFMSPKPQSAFVSMFKIEMDEDASEFKLEYESISGKGVRAAEFDRKTANRLCYEISGICIARSLKCTQDIEKAILAQLIDDGLV